MKVTKGLPFENFQVKDYTRIVYDAAGESQTITVVQFREAFKVFENWRVHLQDGTPLMDLLSDSYFHHNAQRGDQLSV